MNYLYLALAIIGEVIGTTLLKSSNGFTILLPTVLSMLFYGITFYFMSLCMQSIPVGVVYGLWSGIGIVLIALSAFFIHKQPLDLASIVGIAMIVTGVVVMKLFSKSVY